MNLANKLTMLRVCIIPVLIMTFYLNWDRWYWVSALIFILAFVTDLIDGKIARHYDQITNFGKFMDPIADKLLVLSVLVMLCSRNEVSPILVFLILSREFIVSGLRLVAADKGKVIAAGSLGKIKTVLQFIALTAALLRPLLERILGEFSHILIQILLWLSAILSVWSAMDYIMKNKQFIDYRK